MAAPAGDPHLRAERTSERDSTELRALDVYFPETPKRKSFSDLEAICRILDLNGYAKWASQPRLYCIFRVLGLLHRLNDVLNDGATDIWLPTGSEKFKSMCNLDSQEIGNFSAAQDFVLAKRLPSVESWPFRSHVPCDDCGESSISSVSILGRGGYGTVDAVQDHSTAKVVARKRILLSRGPMSKQILKNTCTELDVLKRLYHRHLLDFIGSYSTRSTFALLLSPQAETNLAAYMDGCTEFPGYIGELQGWIGCLASATLYLHNNSIRHYDIKPQNILVNGNNIVLADFGSSEWGSMGPGYTEEGPTAMTARYAPVELIEYEKRDGSADMFSLGCVYLEMLNCISGRSLKDMMNDLSKHHWISYSKIPSFEEYFRLLSTTSSQSISWSVCNLVHSMLNKDRAARPTANQVVTNIRKIADTDPQWCHNCCRDNLGQDSTRREGPRKIVNSQEVFTDQEIFLIGRELAFDQMFQWSPIPRVYITLNLMERLDLMRAFVDAGVTDIWIPLDKQLLRQLLQDPSVRQGFLKKQEAVLSQSMESGKHQHFLDGDDHLQEIRNLGSGGFGSVSHCYDERNQRHVARKLIIRNRILQEGRARDAAAIFKGELEVLRRVTTEGYHHFVKMVGSYTDLDNFAILFSPVADTNLEEYLQSSSDKAYLGRWIGCLALAVRKLHGMRIRHKDIKPQNCLISGNKILLTDFGISRDWSYYSNPTTSGAGFLDPRFCAPEVADWEKRNESADIWSLGCVYLEMLSVIEGKAVKDIREHFGTNGTTQTMYYRNHVAIDSWMDLLEKGSTGALRLSTLVRQMLFIDPSSRIKATEVVQFLGSFREHDEGVGVPFCGLCKAELRELSAGPVDRGAANPLEEARDLDESLQDAQEDF